MADLHDRAVGVIVCAATPQALDHLVAPGHATRVLRVAPDETMFVVAPAFAQDVRRELHDRITALDEDALVLDVSDGWSGLALTGADADRALSYLSALDPPDGDGLVQGDVARVAAKILREPDGLLVLVPAYWGEYMRERAIEDAGAVPS